MKKNRRRIFKDRYDGRLVKTKDPFFRVIPHIMVKRCDSQVYFTDILDITKADAMVKRLRAEGHTNLKLLNLIVAAYVRTVSQRPQINRFSIGRKIFARNDILVSMVLKKGMSVDSLETSIKVKYLPEDTILDVMDKLNTEINKNKVVEEKNDTDLLVKFLNSLPNWFLHFVVGFLKISDNFGLMPKVINKLSPFHCSMFITDLGSVGIEPIYHHIYDFGTTSMFIAFGVKTRDKDGKVTMTIKVVGDERICDGYTYASSLKMFKRLIEHPEALLETPEKTFIDVCAY